MPVRAEFAASLVVAIALSACFDKPTPDWLHCIEGQASSCTPPVCDQLPADVRPPSCQSEADAFSGSSDVPADVPADPGQGGDDGGAAADDGCTTPACTCAPKQCELSSVWNGVGCDVVNKEDGAPCDDGDGCTTEDVCVSGKCTGGPPLSCPDGHHCDGGACVCGALGASCPFGFSCTLGEDPVTPIEHCLDPSATEVYVPGGTFWMGCNNSIDMECWMEEYEPHRVGVGGFVIDRTEVTAADYKACVLDFVCSPPSTTGGPYGTYDPAEKQQHPINYVDWDQAAAFCSWRADEEPGKAWRLCSEAEWEKAARGGCSVNGCAAGDDDCCRTAMPIYPWGNDAPACESPAYAVFSPASPHGCGTGETWAVGMKPAGASPYGALDMAGNVWEWVGDCWHDDYQAGSGAPINGDAWTLECSSNDRVRRGGGYEGDARYVRASVREHDTPSAPNDNLGFRCCASAE